MQSKEFRWDDLRILAALVREGSLSAAAERLGVNPSTIGRRVDALERDLEVRLFDRSPDGAAPTEVAESLFPLAEQFEHVAAEIWRAVHGRETRPEGVVRVTAPPGVASHIVAPLVAEVARRYPRLTIDLDASVGYASLTRREADIALRVSRPEAGDLIAQRLGSARSALVASPAYARELGLIADLNQPRWIAWGWDLAHLPDATWLASHVDPGRVTLRASSIDCKVSAALAGVGVMLLPLPHAELCGLVEVELAAGVRDGMAPLPRGSLWLVTHRVLRHVPRVDAVWRLLRDFFATEARKLQLE